MMELRDGMRVVFTFRGNFEGLRTIVWKDEKWVAVDDENRIKNHFESSIRRFLADGTYLVIDESGQPESSRHLPTDAAKRKDVPLYSGLIRYFPDALCEVAELSRIGNEQHNPGTPLHWDRSKSGDELDAAARHLLEAGTRDTDGVRHSTKHAWRALANLQKEIEAERSS